MKTLLCCLLLLTATLRIQLASAQAAELQQLALNLEKLAQFKSILTDLKRGYAVASRGYGLIKNVTEGNFNVHQVFLNGLLAVNPKLARYEKVKAIVEGQGRLLSEYRSAWRYFGSRGRFTEKELGYIAGVYDNLIDRSLSNIEELTMVLTASELRMPDDQRIKVIDRLYDDIGNKLSFLRQFNSRAAAISEWRGSYLSENQAIKSLYKN